MSNKKEFTYYCGYCKERFKRELSVDSSEFIIVGQQVKCPIGHFLPTGNFI